MLWNESSFFRKKRGFLQNREANEKETWTQKKLHLPPIGTKGSTTRFSKVQRASFHLKMVGASTGRKKFENAFLSKQVWKIRRNSQTWISSPFCMCITSEYLLSAWRINWLLSLEKRFFVIHHCSMYTARSRIGIRLFSCFHNETSWVLSSRSMPDPVLTHLVGIVLSRC